MSSKLTAAARGYVRHAPGTLAKSRIVDHYLNATLRNSPVRAQITTRGGDRLGIDTRDIVQRYLYQFGVWEPNLTAWLQRTLTPGDVFIDVGANIGYFSLLAARLVGPSGSVVAVEASPSALADLRSNVSANSAANVRIVAAAVAADDAELEFYEPRQGIHSVTTSLKPTRDAQPAFTATARALPNHLTDAELTGARVIKIDIEGGEHAALSGLVPVLQDARRDLELVVEVSASLLGQQSKTIAETVELLTTRGYHVYRVANSYRPSSYLEPVTAPKRVRGSITEDADLIFSRIDADHL